MPEHRQRSLGQMLFCRVKRLEGCSAEDLDRVDCLMFECLRSDATTRAAHRCVIEVCSDYFSQEVAKIRAFREMIPCDHRAVNVLRLDISVELLDVILEYFYTRELPHISMRLMIEAYAASKRYGLTELSQHLEEFIRQNAELCLEDETFWDPLNHAADVNLLQVAFDDAALDDAIRTRLLRRVKRWSANGNSGSSNSGSNGGTLDKSKSPLTSAPETPSTTTTPLAGITCVSSLYRTWPMSPRPDVTVALVGPRSVHSHTAEWIAVSMPSLGVIWSSGDSTKNIVTPNERTVVYNNSILIPQGNKIHARDLATNELQREIATYGKRIEGVRIHHGEVFFHSRHEIFALDAQSMTCTKIAYVKAHLMSGFAILKRDADEFTVAVRHAKKLEIRAYSFRRGYVTPVNTMKLQNVPPNMALIGAFGGLLYFLTERSPYCYVAYRGDTEVHRRSIANCLIVMAEIMCNGTLFVLYFADESYNAKYVCAIDLNSDAVVFKRSCSESCLDYASRMIPVVMTNAADSKLQTWRLQQTSKLQSSQPLVVLSSFG